MDVTISYHLPMVSIFAICIMIGALVVAYAKKWMVTYALMIANFIVFVLTLVYTDEILGLTYVNADQSEIFIEIAGLGFRPMYLSLEHSPQLYTLFTSMFVHGGFAHLFGNMFIFLFLGMAFEQRIGAKKFLIIYLVSGICGTLTHSMLNLDYPHNWITLIGASGAIFGIMGAFAFSYPRDEVVMPIPLGIIMIVRRVKVMYVVILFAVIETIIVMVDVQDTTAHFAHIGGLLSGFVLAALLIRKKTHTKKGETIFYDSYNAQQPKEINFSNLHILADTPELKEILNKIENETVPQVQDIWLSHFFEKIKCPKCQSSLNHSDNKIWCENCGFKTKY